jgi:hypothetical protein
LTAATFLRRATVATLAAAFAGLACNDNGSPTRVNPYEWRLFVPSATGLDSLTFRWKRDQLPVRYWVEDSLALPTHVSNAIETWRGAFLYGEWDGTMVSDSSQADVIVRLTTPPPKPSAALRFHAILPECQGATDIDTLATRNQLALPIRIYLDPRFSPGQGDLDTCLEVTTTHELGHSIGLIQHTGDPADVMYADPVTATLSARDIRTVEAIYHLDPDIVPVRP